MSSHDLLLHESLTTNPQDSAASCSPSGRDCYEGLGSGNITCLVECEGLYADVSFENSTENESIKGKFVFESLVEAYNTHKKFHVKNQILVGFEKRPGVTWYKNENMAYHPLQVVQIYFSTATYDKIVNDVSVTLGDQISAIGGTMGLFAGFSILSLVEVLYFCVKFLISFLSKMNNCT